MRNATTCDIAGNTGCHAAILLPLPLVVMGIVDYARLLLTCAPREGCVTLRAPHLIAALNLRNQRGTPRTGAAILGEKLRRCDIIGIADVLGITLRTLELMALGTCPLRTETALPCCTEESTTVSIGALADKGGLGLGLFPLPCH